LYAIIKIIEDNINLLQLYKKGMIVIYTDSKIIVDTFNNNNNNKEKITDKTELRLLGKIIEWDIIIKHIPGKENTIADALSRYKENIIKHMNESSINNDYDITVDSKQMNNTKEINIITLNEKRINEKSKWTKRRDKYRYTNHYIRYTNYINILINNSLYKE